MPADHDAYIAEAPEDLRPLLVRLRAQLARALPDAEEIIAYKMPGFRIGQSIVAGYAALWSRRAWSAQVQWATAAAILVLAAWTPRLAIVDSRGGCQRPESGLALSRRCSIVSSCRCSWSAPG